MKALTLIPIILVTLCIPALGQSITVGSQAPAFTVYHGEKDALNSSSRAGTVLVVTYETKDVVEKNRSFKHAVLSWCASAENKDRAVMTVPVINCFKYIWPFSSACEQKVEEHSQKEHLRIYTDRDGRMFQDFGIRDNESNIFIIDKKGIIRFAKAGKLLPDEIPAIIKLLGRLARDNRGEKSNE